MGKLLTVAVLAVSFLFGMAGVLYLALQGREVKVPEIVGKNFGQSQDELESLGLRIKRRADRYSEEAPDTVLEQLPKPGETVKTGQLIFVVVSKSNPEGEDKPATIKKEEEKGDTEKIEELISEKPKKKNVNSNVNGASNTVKKEGEPGAESGAANTPSASNTKPAAGSDQDKDKNKDKKDAKQSPQQTKPGAPAASKTPARTGGETRPKRVP